MAKTTGFEEFSMAERSWVRSAPAPLPAAMDLANSLMSAPATKVRPSPMMTMAVMAGLSWAAWRAAARPSGTPGLSALTGGLLMPITAMGPWIDWVMSWVIWFQM